MAKHTLEILNTARFFNYVWSFYNIMHERVKDCGIDFLYSLQKKVLLEKIEIYIIGHIFVKQKQQVF